MYQLSLVVATATIFSLLPSVTKFIRITSICLISSNASLSYLYSSHPPTKRVLIALLICHKRTSVHRLPPPPDYRYASLFFLAGPVPIHEIAVSAFSSSPLGRVNTSSFQCLLLSSSIAPNVLPLPPSYLPLAFPFFLSLTSVLHP